MILPAIFLYYNQKYFKTDVLLDKLIHLFWNYPMPSCFISKDFPAYFYANHVLQARSNILRLLAWWVTFYRDDFDSHLDEKLVTFLD